MSSTLSPVSISDSTLLSVHRTNTNRKRPRCVKDTEVEIVDPHAELEKLLNFTIGNTDRSSNEDALKVRRVIVKVKNHAEALGVSRLEQEGCTLVEIGEKIVSQSNPQNSERFMSSFRRFMNNVYSHVFSWSLGIPSSMVDPVSHELMTFPVIMTCFNKNNIKETCTLDSYTLFGMICSGRTLKHPVTRNLISATDPVHNLTDQGFLLQSMILNLYGVRIPTFAKNCEEFLATLKIKIEQDPMNVLAYCFTEEKLLSYLKNEKYLIQKIIQCADIPGLKWFIHKMDYSMFLDNVFDAMKTASGEKLLVLIESAKSRISKYRESNFYMASPTEAMSYSPISFDVNID